MENVLYDLLCDLYSIFREIGAFLWLVWPFMFVFGLGSIVWYAHPQPEESEADSERRRSRFIAAEIAAGFALLMMFCEVESNI